MTTTVQIVIPAFNEAARLPRTIALLSAWLSTQPGWGPVEVIVVDNASTDDTSLVARGLSTAALPIQVLHCSVPGKGAAVRAGILETTADLVAFVDADGATSFEALSEAVALVDRGADIVIGSRAVPGSVTMVRHSRLRERGAAAYRWSTAKLVPGIRDTQCGFKVFRGHLARRILAETRTVGFSFDVEVLRRAQLLGCQIVELPVTWVDVPGSTFSPALHGLESFRQLLVIGVRLRRPARTSAPRSGPVGHVLSEMPAAGRSLDA